MSNRNVEQAAKRNGESPANETSIRWRKEEAADLVACGGILAMYVVDGCQSGILPGNEADISEANVRTCTARSK